MSNFNIVVPKIVSKSLNHKNWSVEFYEEFSSILLDTNGEVLAPVKQVLINGIDHATLDFKMQFNLETVPFLVGHFVKEQKLRLYTPRLNLELFLLSNLVEIESKQDITAFKQYVDYVSSLDNKEFPTNVELATIKYNLTNLFDKTWPSKNTEAVFKTTIDKLLIHLNSYGPSLFEKFSDFSLGLTAKYALLRIHLLKFIAILPGLEEDDGREVKKILLESLRRLLDDNKVQKKDLQLPTYLFLALKIGKILASVCPHAQLALIVRESIKLMAKRFIAGESIETSNQVISDLALTGRDVTLDQLGELVVSEMEAEKYCNEVLKLIKGFSLHIEKGARNKAGINRAHVSIKVSALCSDFRPEDFDYTFSLTGPRLRKILIEAQNESVFINVDAEHYHFRDIVFEIYKKVLLTSPELKDFKDTGIVVQAYLRDGVEHLREVIELAKTRGLTMPIRLVKGAYWDAETVEARAHNFNAPQFLNKDETDIYFRQMIVEIYKAYPHIQLCIASHNFADHAYAFALKEAQFPELPAIEHQCLHMTYEALSTALSKMGWAVRNYVPIGSLLVGMAYLVRRIMENSSQVGVLNIMRSHKNFKAISFHAPVEQLLEKKKKDLLALDLSFVGLTKEFFNVTPVRTYLRDELSCFKSSLAMFEKNLGVTYHNENTTGELTKILSSSDLSIHVGSIKFATREDTKKALDTLYKSYEKGEWANSHALYRASILLKAAQIMLAKRLELSALIIFEAGKTINEALGDVDEAIDFLYFYAREEVSFCARTNDVFSKGVIGVIAPWNFPLAIPCGMCAGALVAGNTVILKSAEQTPLIAEKLTEIFYEAGVPKDVFKHVPGLGEVAGVEISEYKNLAGIVFTGSKNVGVHLFKTLFSQTIKNPITNNIYPKTIVTEMGGKNAVIVTRSAELDETVVGILKSSFGHAGQKCSACSRVIVDNRVKDKLVARLKEAIKDIKVGPAFDMSSFVNPIISPEDADRIRRQAVEAGLEAKNHGGKVVIDRTTEKFPGNCVAPVLIEIPSVRALDKSSFAQTEIFGPMVHVIGFDTIDEAIEIFNSTDYALTGGVFSQSQDDLDYVIARIKSGNIYVNRNITGARVGIEPFGGFKLSGTGPKAGGVGYLHAFHTHKREKLPHKTLIDEGHEKIDLKVGPVSFKRSQMAQVISRLVDEFEIIFPRDYSNNKEMLKSLQKTAMIDFNFIRPNVEIPGQVSQTDLNLKKEGVVFLAKTDNVTFSLFYQLLMANLNGCRVNVLCFNPTIFNWFKRVENIFRMFEIDNNDFNVIHSSQYYLDILLQEQCVEVIMLDAGADTLHDELTNLKNGIFASNSNLKVIPRIITSMDYCHQAHKAVLLSQFVNERSFAINIMRHGAPLELQSEDK